MKPIERKFMRMRLCLDQKTIAEKMGVSIGYISRLENQGYDVDWEKEQAYERLLIRLEAERQQSNAEV